VSGTAALQKADVSNRWSKGPKTTWRAATASRHNVTKTVRATIAYCGQAGRQAGGKPLVADVFAA